MDEIMYSCKIFNINFNYYKKYIQIIITSHISGEICTSTLDSMISNVRVGDLHTIFLYLFNIY